MEEYLNQLANKGLGVSLWKNEKGWLAALLDDNLDMIPGSTTWNYHKSPESAIEQLWRTSNDFVKAVGGKA